MSFSNEKYSENSELDSSILLSVCIPTYNRLPFLSVSLPYLVTLLDRVFKENYEIVVSNNHSTDNTKDFLENNFSTNNKIRVYSPPQHYKTGEENLCFALAHCRGEYIWTLGDDDIPVEETLSTLFTNLNKKKHDLLIFNCKIVSQSGHVRRQLGTYCLQPQLDIDLLDFIRVAGFFQETCRFCNVVFRRHEINLDKLKDILKIGKIYAHVPWLISEFYDKKFTFINQPLTVSRDYIYRDHWEKFSQKEGTFWGHHWTVGFLRLLDYLVECGIIERRFLKEVVSQGYGNLSYFWNDILGFMLSGLKYKGKIKLRKITESEMKYFISWVREVDGENLPLVVLFEDMVRAIGLHGKPTSKQIEKFGSIVYARQATNWFQPFHRYDAYGYAVFRHSQKWFAILLGQFDTVSFLLKNTDFDDFKNILFVRNSEQELLNVLKTQDRQSFSFEQSSIIAPRNLPKGLALLRAVFVVYRREGARGVLSRILARLFNDH